jgi:hypothetical protein
MAKSIIPIGRSLGWTFDGDGNPSSFEWFRGDDILELTPNEALALAQAFEEHQAHFHCKFDRDAYFSVLRRNATTLQESELSSIVGELFRKGLLLEFDPDAASIEAVFKGYRMIPTARSHGSTSDQPDSFGIGHTEPIIVFSGWSQILWAVSHTDGSIWRGCELLVREDGEAAPIDAAREFARVLPVIVATECGYLEAI